MLDNQVLITYITEKLGGKVGTEYSAAQGRIKIMTADEAMAPQIKLYNEALAKLEIAEYSCVAKAVAGKKQVTVTWNASSASDVQYVVYRSTKKSSGYKKVATVSTNKYVNKKLTSGKTYYYKVKAVKKVGDSNYYGRFSAVKSAKAK